MTLTQFYFWLTGIWTGTAVLIAKAGMDFLDSLAAATGVFIVGLLIGYSLYSIRSRRHPDLDERRQVVQGTLAWAAIWSVFHLMKIW